MNSKSPLKSVGLGLLSLFILKRLPVVGILGLVLRVALTFFKPAALVFGGVKLWQMAKARRPDVSQAAPESHF